jgi:hypothetical protein
MATDIEVLKQEIEELKAISKDTNRSVRKMRSSQRMHTFFTVLWWLTIVGVTGYTYITYVQPYVEKITSAYDNTKDLQAQVQEWFAQFGRTSGQ